MDPADPGDRTDRNWTVTVDADPRLERVAEALCTLADGQFGTPRVPGGGRRRLGSADPRCRRLPRPRRRNDAAARPGLDGAPGRSPPDGYDRRELDLHGGVLRRTWRTADGTTLRTLRFASLAGPGVVGLRAEGPAGALAPGRALLDHGNGIGFGEGHHGDIAWARTRSAGGGGITAAACQHTTGGGRVVERLAAYLADSDRAPPPEAAAERLREVETVGVDRLLAEHRAAWAARWVDAEVTIQGDPDAEQAVRFVLFHLLASVAGQGEAAVGARGLTGPVYAGHVFWDADVFVLPVLAAAQGRSGGPVRLGVGC